MSGANKYLSNSNFNLKNKSVLVRIDSDIDLSEKSGQLVVDEPFRLKSALPTLEFLDQAGVKKIILAGHLGRPGGQTDPKLSLAPIAKWFTQNYKSCDLIINHQSLIISHFSLLENLRFYSGERANGKQFALKLSSLADVYTNEAFGSSHRDHASITGVPKHLPSFLGLNFEQEIKNLTKIKKNAKRPLVIVLGGSKKGKMDYIPFLANLADSLLIGGKLPFLRRDHTFKVSDVTSESSQGMMSEIKWADLKSNNRDISRESIRDFKQVINQASTIFMVGPLGVYEEEENRYGTMEIAKVIAKSSAFKLAAGGDTHRVLSWLNLWGKFDFVSTGGGAALQFLREEILPGITAVSNS